MGWAFKTNLPTPNPDRSLLLPLTLSTPIYILRDLYTLFVGFQWSTAQMLEEFKAYDARRLGTRYEDPALALSGRTPGHFAAFTQPDRFLTELLSRVRPLASAPKPSSTEP